MVTLIAVDDLAMVGGNLALDFVNTRSGPPGGEPDVEALAGYRDLVAWAERARVLDRAEADELARHARRHREAAIAAFARAMALRGALFDVFSSIADHRAPPEAALRRLRDDAAEALARASLQAGAAGFRWSWADGADLDRPWWPVAHAATRLLTEGRLDRLKGCGGCRFLFLDETKNGSRRWCSMADCGTRAKTRRFVARRSAARTGTRTATTAAEE